MDCERGPFRRKLNSRCAGGKCGGSLKKRRIQIERRNLPRGFPPPIVRAHGADEVDGMSQSSGMDTKVQWCAAQANRVRENIPQNFADRSDGFRGMPR